MNMATGVASTVPRWSNERGYESDTCYLVLPGTSQVVPGTVTTLVGASYTVWGPLAPLVQGRAPHPLFLPGPPGLVIGANSDRRADIPTPGKPISWHIPSYPWGQPGDRECLIATKNVLHQKLALKIGYCYRKTLFFELTLFTSFFQSPKLRSIFYRC